MIYEETSGTSGSGIYETDMFLFLLLETGAHLLLESGGRFLLEAGSSMDNLYDPSTGTNPDPIYDGSTISGTLFLTTSGTSPDNPFEEES